MYNMVESIFVSKELYLDLLDPVCGKYGLAHTELLILLFLANNPQHNTATDIVEKRRLTKSTVSMAVKTLQARGLIVGEYINGNHRSIHLKVCDSAQGIVAEGNAAQERFFEIVFAEFSDEERANIKQYMERLTVSIKAYNKSARRSGMNSR